MPNSPTIIVLVPTKSRAKLLTETLASTLTQTFSDFELVISNNHSNDETATVLQKYAALDTRIRVLIPPMPLAMTENWNYVWSQSRREYGAYLSDDDLWQNTFLERVVKVAEQHPNLDVIGSN